MGMRLENVKMGNAEVGRMEWPFLATIAYSLLKLCTDHDLSFVNASLHLAARESLQTLTAQYQKFYKFSIYSPPLHSGNV